MESSEGVPTYAIVMMAVSAVAVVVFLAILLRKALAVLPRGKVAEVEADPGKPFELRFVPRQDQDYRLFLAYRLHSVCTGGTASRGLSGLAGMACSFEVAIGGRQAIRQTVGYGSDVPGPVDRVETVSYYTRVTAMGSDLTKNGTMPLTVLGRCRAGEEIAVSGTIVLNHTTDASLLKVFIAR